MKSRKFKTVLVTMVSLALVCVFAIPAFASSHNWSVNLPGSGYIDIVSGYKRSPQPQSVWVSLDHMGGDYKATNFIVRAHNSRGWPDVTAEHTFYTGGISSGELPFTETVPTNTELMLRGANEDWAFVHVAANGQYDFH